MKSFQQFITEVNAARHAELRDKEGLGGGTGLTHRGGEKIGSDRKKSEPEKRRVKAVGGGKTAPAQDYKPRKDIGTQRPKSTREQQPEKERGTAALSAKEAQKKAYRERKAKERGAKTKTATELLTTKKKETVDPKYKQQKASGLTQKERDTLRKKGERKLRDLRLQVTGKTKESELKYPVTTKEVNRRNKNK